MMDVGVDVVRSEGDKEVKHEGGYYQLYSLLLACKACTRSGSGNFLLYLQRFSVNEQSL